MASNASTASSSGSRILLAEDFVKEQRETTGSEGRQTMAAVGRRLLGLGMHLYGLYLLVIK